MKKAIPLLFTAFFTISMLTAMEKDEDLMDIEHQQSNKRKHDEIGNKNRDANTRPRKKVKIQKPTLSANKTVNAFDQLPPEIIQRIILQETEQINTPARFVQVYEMWKAFAQVNQYLNQILRDEFIINKIQCLKLIPNTRVMRVIHTYQKIYHKKNTYPLLHAVLFSEDINTVKTYIENNDIDINEIIKVDRRGRTLLHIAVECGDCNIVGYLVSKGADINKMTYYGLTSLGLAIFYGHIEIVKYFIKKCKININQINNALYVAISVNKYNLVKYLIKHGAEVYQKDIGVKFLHRAVSHGNLKIVKYFIEKCGIDTQRLTQAFLLLGITDENYHLVQYLTERDINVYQIPYLLEAAVLYGRLEVIKHLVEECNINPNQTEYAGCFVPHNAGIPLHWAAYHGHIKIVKYLIKHGANVTLQTDDGRTALDIAREEGHQEIIDLLSQFY